MVVYKVIALFIVSPLVGTCLVVEYYCITIVSMKKLKEVIALMKDKASRGKAVILSKPITLSLLRATSHDSFTPPTQKHLSTLLSTGDGSRATASAAIELLMDRLQTTNNSAVALKCLIVVHHIINRGTFILRDQLSVYPYTGGRNYLNLSNFRDKTSSISWELSSWVRWYAQYIEHLICASRTLGLYFHDETTTFHETKEERVSCLVNSDLLLEIDALLVVVEGIGKRPSNVTIEGNKLVVEIMSLAEDDGIVALTEVLVRVNEFRMRERLGCFGFGEVVELVCVLKRLEDCRERMMVRMMEMAREMRLWDYVRELKEKVSGMKVYKEDEGKLYRNVTKHREIESERIDGRVLNSVDFIRFPSSRFF